MSNLRKTLALTEKPKKTWNHSSQSYLRDLIDSPNLLSADFRSYSPVTNESSSVVLSKMLTSPSSIAQPGGGAANVYNRRTDLQQIFGQHRDHNSEAATKMHSLLPGWVTQTKPIVEHFGNPRINEEGIKDKKGIPAGPYDPKKYDESVITVVPNSVVSDAIDGGPKFVLNPRPQDGKSMMNVVGPKNSSSYTTYVLLAIGGLAVVYFLMKRSTTQ